MSAPYRLAIWLQWIASAAAVAACTALGAFLHFNPATMGFFYLIVVLLFSISGGLALGLATSVVATACYNFFFLPPVGTFTISDPANWAALAAFFLASFVASRLVVRAQRQADEAEARRNDIEVLYNLTLELFTATNRVGALGEAAGRALTSIGAKGGGLVLFRGSSYRQNVIWWNGDRGDEIEDLIAGVGRHKDALEIPSAYGRDVYLPLILGGKPTGVLVARGVTAPRSALESVATLVSLAVEREKFLAENAHLQALKESDALKTSLLRAVSHDLTTPLTAISLQLETLKRHVAADQLPMVAALEAESVRLRRRIENLLAMARLEAGSFVPKPEPTPPADLFRAVRENLPLIRETRSIDVHVDADCPDLLVDPSLALEIVVNLVENAHRASPAGEFIQLVARRHPVDASRVRLEVLDRGPGIRPRTSPGLRADDTGEIDVDSDVASRGLGLEIARSLAAANGGSVTLANRPGGGTIARVDLPAALIAEAAS
ncbi:MAG TPA: DUF4118 domain-containing protein [Thermoanaerobaculia bacterium]|nr:DUF4118 domain-containing protein [Thermoanaerobaculia bacterium]